MMNWSQHLQTWEAYLPISTLDVRFWMVGFFVVSFFIVFRYFLLTGFFWLLFFKIRPQLFSQRQLYKELPTTQQQKKEIFWSVSTTGLFAIIFLVWAFCWEKGWTQIYLRFDDYGIWFLPVSWVILVILHDVYFYWTHRWLHQPHIYKKFHYVHHESLKPSPWASFSFHPVEAGINALAVPFISFLVPLHPTVILFHLTFMTITATINHLGFEIYPKKIQPFFIGAHHHALHHRFFNCNYGLFFPALDLWMKTEEINPKRLSDRL